MGALCRDVRMDFARSAGLISTEAGSFCETVVGDRFSPER